MSRMQWFSAIICDLPEWIRIHAWQLWRLHLALQCVWPWAKQGRTERSLNDRSVWVYLLLSGTLWLGLRWTLEAHILSVPRQGELGSRWSRKDSVQPTALKILLRHGGILGVCTLSLNVVVWCFLENGCGAAFWQTSKRPLPEWSITIVPNPNTCHASSELCKLQ